MIARTPKLNLEYVLKAERLLSLEEQTVFFLRPLTVGERALLLDQQFTFEQGSGIGAYRAGSMQLAIVRACLTGWKNLRNEEGDEVPFETTEKSVVVLGIPRRVVTDECLALIADVMAELAGAIEATARIDEATAKN